MPRYDREGRLRAICNLLLVSAETGTLVQLDPAGEFTAGNVLAYCLRGKNRKRFAPVVELLLKGGQTDHEHHDRDDELQA